MSIMSDEIRDRSIEELAGSASMVLAYLEAGRQVPEFDAAGLRAAVDFYERQCGAPLADPDDGSVPLTFAGR
jgi:hypothetical protein